MDKEEQVQMQQLKQQHQLEREKQVWQQIMGLCLKLGLELVLQSH